MERVGLAVCVTDGQMVIVGVGHVPGRVGWFVVAVVGRVRVDRFRFGYRLGLRTGRINVGKRRLNVKKRGKNGEGLVFTTCVTRESRAIFSYDVHCLTNIVVVIGCIILSY